MTKQRGFGAIMAIVILVILAALAAAIVRFGSVQQAGSAQDILSARAWQVAKAGTEWGLYQALKGASCVGGAGTTLDLRATTGMQVTVVCTPLPVGVGYYYEGQTCATLPCTATAVTVYQIDAVACNSSTSCPDAAMAVSASYIERKREVIATN